MKVAVIGAGVIGLTLAYELVQRGAEVTVLDRAEPGAAASWGNAGWITTSLSAPVPAPGIIGSSLKLLLQPEGPLYVKPRLDPGYLRWLMDFALKSNRRDYERGLGALSALNEQTYALFDRLRANLDFEMHSEGLLFLFLTEEKMHHSLETFDVLERHGHRRPPVLSLADIRQMVPDASDAVIGGYLVEPERHVNPGSLTDALVRALEAKNMPVRSGVEVTGFRRRGHHVEAIDSATGPIGADAYVIAAGAWSGRVARQAGFRLPIEAGKGYSVTISHPNVRLPVPMYLGEALVAVTPFDESLRLGGTMEFSGVNDRVDSRRIAAIRRSAASYLTTWPSGDGEREWGGMRPLAPDGLPVLGKAPGFDNLYVATGHSMLGVTLAPTTAMVMSDLIYDGETTVDIGAFDPGRFGGDGEKRRDAA